MNGITSCVKHTLQHVPRIFATSGHFAFQYGRYTDCLESKDYRYHMVEFDVNHTTKGVTMGLCLPNQCSNHLVFEVLTKAFKISGLPIGIVRVQSDVPNYQFPYGWVYYLTVIILLIFALLALVSSIRKDRAGILKPFAIQESLEKLKTKQSNLNVFNGVRALTMMWVVMGDTFVNSIIGSINVLTLDLIFRKPFILIVEATLLTSDIFFSVGGFFLAYKFAKYITGPISNYPLAIIRKALRVWPTYLLTILVWYTMFMHLGSGPKWIVNQQYTGLCKNMWRTALFVDNLVNNGHTLCMSWAFYMQLEFQIFLVSLVLLFIYSKNKMVAFIMTALLIIYSWTINLMYSEQNGQKYPISFEALSGFQYYIFDVFIKPHMRWTPYFFGVVVGLCYYQYEKVQDKQNEPRETFKTATFAGKIIMLKEVLEKRKNLRRGIEWSGMAIMAFVVFFPRTLQVGYQWSQAFHSMCLNFGRCLFPFTVFMVIMPTLLGVEGSFFRTVLVNKPFNFLSKISYSVYLIHGLTILGVSGNKIYDTYFSITDQYVTVLGIIVITCFFGFIMTVAVQYPCRTILKRLTGEETDDIIVKTELTTTLTETNEINRTIAALQE